MAEALKPETDVPVNACVGKSLPVLVKNYKETRPKAVVIYAGQHFGIFPFLEFLRIYLEVAKQRR